MQPLLDETAFGWISDARNARNAPESSNRQSADRRGVIVSDLIPPTFDAYARILHRMDAQHQHVDFPLSVHEIAILKIPSCEPLKSFVEQRRVEGKGTRVRWRELAELLHVPFQPEISHLWYREKLDGWCLSHLLGPPDPVAREQERSELISHLSQRTSSELCLFRFSDIPFYPTPHESSPRLFSGTLDEVKDLPKSGPYSCGPEYWWPNTREWCVCSDYDLQATIVGGSGDLIASVLKSNVLESLEVTTCTRVDPLAPMPR